MPITTQREMQALQPPPGFRWQERPVGYDAGYGRVINDAPVGMWEWGTISMTDVNNLTLVGYQQLLQTFIAWAKENGLPFRCNNDVGIRDGENVYRGWTSWIIRPLNAREGELWHGNSAPNIARYSDDYTHGRLTIRAGAVFHPMGGVLDCQECHRVGVEVVYFDDGARRVCKDCVRQCPARIPNNAGLRNRCMAEFYGTARGCEACYPRVDCAGCPARVEQGQAFLMGDSYYCNQCAARVCQNCHQRVDHDLVFNDNAQLSVCQACNAEFARQPNARAEQFEDEEVDAAELLIAAHPNRPVRFASIEMEIATGGAPVIQELNRQGLSLMDFIGDYHHGERQAGAGSFCYMERDASLGAGGGELIFPKLVMDNPLVVDKLHRSIKVVRDHVKNGQAAMDMRCGLHIHVDAHKFGIGHTRNLALLFNFLEDPLYRMSAARYMRHRGFNYAAKLEKRYLDDEQAFGLRFLGQNGHTHALNVGNYWQAMRNNCRCGANIIGRHDKCECNLGKCTFEFRIYNGTANFRKVHAYTAMSLAMVGFARGAADLRTADFPSFEYNEGRQVDDTLKAQWFTHLSWMFKNLYFAENERRSMHYVIKNCSLNELGDARLQELEAVRYEGVGALPQPGDMTVVNAATPNQEDAFYAEEELDWDGDEPF